MNSVAWSPERALRAVVWCIVATLGAPVSCLYDPDERCGDHQQLDGEECVCASGYGLTAGECVECGDNEVGSPRAGCECETGYARLEEGGACEKAAGDRCQSDDDCTTENAGHCQMEGDSGYCTSTGCDAADDECNGDFSCNDRGDVPFCERPPTGYGVSCASSDDCAEFEASYCEVLSEKVCLLSDCASDPDRCPGSWVCCDIALLGTSLCLPQEELSDGVCPAAGTLIPRD